MLLLLQTRAAEEIARARPMRPGAAALGPPRARRTPPPPPPRAAGDGDGDGDDEWHHHHHHHEDAATAAGLRAEDAARDGVRRKRPLERTREARIEDRAARNSPMLERQQQQQRRQRRFAVVSRRVLLLADDDDDDDDDDEGETPATRWAHAVLVVDARSGTFEAIVEVRASVAANCEAQGEEDFVHDVIESYGVANVQDVGDAMVIPGIVDVGYHYLPALRSQDSAIEDVDAAMAQATMQAASGGVTTIVDTPREALPAALALSLLAKRASLLRKCSRMYADVGMISRVDLRSNLDSGLLSRMRDHGCLGVAVHLSTLGTDALSNAISITKTAARRAHGPGGVPAASKNSGTSASAALAPSAAGAAAAAGPLNGGERSALVRPSRGASLLKALSQLKMAFVVDVSKVARPLGHETALGDASRESSPASNVSAVNSPMRRKAMRVAQSDKENNAVNGEPLGAKEDHDGEEEDGVVDAVTGDLAPRLGRLVMTDETDLDEDDLLLRTNRRHRYENGTAPMEEADSGDESLHNDLRDLRRRHVVEGLKASPAFRSARTGENNKAPSPCAASLRAPDTPDRASVASQYSTPTRTQPVARRVPRSARSCGNFTLGQRAAGSPASVASNSSLRSLRRQRRSSSFNLRSWRLDRDEFCSEESDTVLSAASPSSLAANDSVRDTPSSLRRERTTADATPTPRETLWVRRRRHNSRSVQRFRSDSLDCDPDDLDEEVAHQQHREHRADGDIYRPQRFGAGSVDDDDDDDDDDDLPAGALELTDAGGFAERPSHEAPQRQSQPQNLPSPAAPRATGGHGLPPVGQPPAYTSARRQRFANRRTASTRTPEPGEPAHEASDIEDGTLLDEEVASEITYPDAAAAARRRAFAKHASPRLSVSSFASLGSGKHVAGSSSAPMLPAAQAPVAPSSSAGLGSSSSSGVAPVRRHSAFSSPGGAARSPAGRRRTDSGCHGRSSSLGSLGSPGAGQASEHPFARATAFQPRGRFASGELGRLQNRLGALGGGAAGDDSGGLDPGAGTRPSMGKFQSPSGPVRLLGQHRLHASAAEESPLRAGDGAPAARQANEVQPSVVVSSSSSTTSSWCNQSSSSTSSSSSTTVSTMFRQEQQQQQHGRPGLLCTGGPKLSALQALVKLLASAQRTRGARSVSKVRLTLGESDAQVLAEEAKIIETALRDADVQPGGIVVSARAFGPVQTILTDSWMGPEAERLEAVIDRLTRDAAATLGLQASKGRLAAGFDADFVVLRDVDANAQVKVDRTFCRGVLVFTSAEPGASPIFPPGRLIASHEANL